MNIDDLIQDLHSLPDAELDRVRGYVAALKEIAGEKETAEDRFWYAIGLLDWDAEEVRGEGDDAVVKPLIDYLASQSVDEIFSYATILHEKLRSLDGPAYHEQSKTEHSADSFLYMRCAVVANGKDFYSAVLKDPTLFPDDKYYAPLLYCEDKAYEQKTGKEYDYFSGIIYESFFNDDLWGEGATFAKIGVTPEDVEARATAMI